MKDLLKKLLRTTDRPTPLLVQRRWDEYRVGVDSQDATTKAAADAGFSSLLAWYGDALYRHIWGFIRSDGAEDVFQDVLKKLHEQRRDPRLASFHQNVLPWLRTVAIRQCIDAHRRSARRRHREMRTARSSSETSEGERSVELQEFLALALAKLPSHQQQAIALHFFEGLDRQDAATELGIHRDTFSTHLEAALQRLRQLIATPVAIALGSELALTSALAAVPRLPSADRLSVLASAAWSGAAKSTGTHGHLAIWVGLAVALGGTAVTGWILMENPETAPALVSRVSPVDDRAPESLQDRNVRVTRDDVLPLLLKIGQRMVPEDNRLNVVHVRAFGSEIECEFRTERPIIPSWNPVGLRVRYCTLMRYLEIAVDIEGKGTWKAINPERPVILDFAIPGLPVPAVDLGRRDVADAKAAFDGIPDDNRAEAEQIRRLFGDDSTQLIMPSGLRGFAARAGRLYVVTEQRGLFSRDPSGRWRFEGECPGWWLTADSGRLFCTLREEVWMRPLEAPNRAWVQWSGLPNLTAGESRGFLAAAGDRLFAVVQPGVLCSRSISDPEPGWVREAASVPIWPDGIAATTDRLFAHDTKNVLTRPSEKPGAEWTPVARWPERMAFLAVDRDRMLTCGGPGPILARPLAAGSESDWEVVGQVRVPPAR